MATLHIHIDEAGNFDFSPRGSRYYVFAVAWTYDPSPLARGLEAVRFGLLKTGIDVCHLHAAEDAQATRDQVVKVLAGHAEWLFASVVVQKNKVFEPLRDPTWFYAKFLTSALRFVLRGRVRDDTSGILIYTDRLPTAKKASVRAFEKAVKKECAADLPKGYPVHMYHHPSESNYWLQAVDYACWGVQRKWETGDTRTYDALRGRLAVPELDVLSRGDRAFY